MSSGTFANLMALLKAAFLRSSCSEVRVLTVDTTAGVGLRFAMVCCCLDQEAINESVPNREHQY